MASGYGTVMVGRLAVPVEDVEAAIRRWVDERKVAGFRHEDILVCEDGKTVVVAVHFDDKASYEALAADPEQAAWWASVAAPQMEGDPTWYDGTWRVCISAG